ncbi:MAG: DivIVA domain-containing protein [Synergistaceae bacterium]|nr:DivIVA domain-containing protein [Synergistaceae bacterium]MBQ3450088.1 DivIVA domain-containing protein [Synergistaceae bacterium]MBQ3693803.1 DivIVA domain-containing protein [Synergistaceae bacterium]MBR0069782.1 DivIVA domain-containing protein [Synergistaceae bacterium]MBR0250807.1 DivIVA domain-containing protein [Synergistaceae bacterium]
MSELLTAKDIEVKEFKKVRFGGYSVPEVEDFLNQVADDIEAYAIQLDEKDARIIELESYAKKQDEMTDAIKDALIQARQSAKEIEDKAQAQTEKIIADAKEQAARIISEADGKVQARLNEADAKANEVLSRAKVSAEEMTLASQDRRAKADKSLANIEQELESRRHEAEAKAEEILSSARTEARRMLADAEKQASEYDGQLRFLNLRKQQFLKDAYSLLADFGKVIERAQEEIDSEMAEEAEESIDAVNEEVYDTHSVLEFAPESHESHEDVSEAPDAHAEEK